MFPVYYSAAPPLTAARGCPRATYFNFKNRQQGQLVLLFTMKIQYHPSNSRHIQAATICCTRHLGAFYQGVLSVWCVYGHCNLTSHFTGLNLSDNQTCSSFLTRSRLTSSPIRKKAPTGLSRLNVRWTLAYVATYFNPPRDWTNSFDLVWKGQESITLTTIRLSNNDAGLLQS